MMKTFPDISGPGNNQTISVTNSTNIPVPVKESVLARLIGLIEKNEEVRFSYIELVYVDEKKIIELNRKYLGKTYVTDIITFRYDEDATNRNIEGTLFCCSSRITEQSREIGTPEITEFYRIFIHGLLHLAGFDDQTDEQKTAMTTLENRYLQELNLPL